MTFATSGCRVVRKSSARLTSCGRQRAGGRGSGSGVQAGPMTVVVRTGGLPVVLGMVLLWWELRVSRPFIDVRMLRANRPLSRTYARVAVTYVVFYTIFYGVPQWLEQGRLLSSAGAGLVVLPIAGMGIVATVIATRRPRLPLL